MLHRQRPLHLQVPKVHWHTERQVRTLRKKLQQIEVLLQRAAASPEAHLDPQQQNKVAMGPALQAALDASLAGASVQVGLNSCPHISCLKPLYAIQAVSYGE